MRKLLTAVLCMGLLIPCLVNADGILDVNQSKYINDSGFLGYVQDRIIVVMKDDVGKLNFSMSASASVHIGEPEFDQISDRYAVSKINKQFPGAETKAPALAKNYKITFNNGNLDEVMAAYRAHPMVEKVEPIGIHAMCATPNDTYYDPYQWYHNQTNDDDIDSPEAWDIQTGNSSIILAILDSGTRYYHPDLGGVNATPTNVEASRGNMWINTAELNGSSGVDDDGNGYVDDWIGYDFVSSTTQCWNGEDCGTQDNDPRDFNGHGTHTAGIVGMITNDGYGMAGVAGGWNNGSQTEYGNGVKVMPLRMGYSYNYLGQEYGVVLMDAAAEAFYYAADNGARIASCSWGSSNSGGIAAAADYFIANGGLIFVAAGNDGTETPGYLNSRSDCISVAATDENDGAASFTTYGTWVDISAPGTGIYSTYHDHTDPDVNYWAALDGTSMACPMAAATGAMIWSQNPTWTAAQVESQLYSSADNIDAELTSTYIGKMGAGRINLYNAVNTGPQCDVAADFSGTPTSGCAPLTVNFTDLSTGTGIDGWSWDFGDGGSSTAQNPSYTYTAPGTYTVTLTASSSSQSCNDVVTKTGYITVNGGPTADFTGSPTSGIEPLTVNFTDQSTDATGWSWDFGDGGSSTAQNPSYTYTTAGTYSVTLTATNACGSDALTRTDYITVNPCVAPVANFSGSPTSGVAPLTVDFTDLSSDATGWSWNFGDGGSSTAQNPSYTYTATGTYSVTLTVTNACGSDALTMTDYITVNEPQNATAYAQSDISVLGTYTGSYTNTYLSDNVYEAIVESESTNHPRKITSNAEHKWTFNVAGGGSNYMFYLEGYRTDNAEGDDFIFEYSTDDATYLSLFTVNSSTETIYSASLPNLSGTVYVRVTDTDRSWGNTILDAMYIDEMYFESSTTPGPPVADFVGTPTSGSAPLNVSFTDLSTGSPTSWSWDFGDGGTSTAQNPSYSYTANGTYTVSLTVTNAYGSDNETKTGYITVADQSNNMHVDNMVVGRAKSGPDYYGTCDVTIADANSLPVSGATVYVTATGPTGGTFSAISGADGVASFATSGMKKPSGEWCFEVTNVTHASYSYDSGANNVTAACESGWLYGAGVGAMVSNQPIPDEFDLAQNYPNPFNPTTTIAFSLPQASTVNISVYNIVGQKVATVAEGSYQAGVHYIEWDATEFPSGVYFYRIEAGSFTKTEKMMLLK